ncbi:hypothetical protein IE53DRAFT_387033 [Violaceomyces palustris]|uniref:Uncharacterized protein n=1 Tax=Violaceomyces palustris TaxID=1673888 RepID=A0ACD0NXX1_9BASI|nr:hypothetical protein IE53DRAFT_387033 [Violaceomyces palustris]
MHAWCSILPLSTTLVDSHTVTLTHTHPHPHPPTFKDHPLTSFEKASSSETESRMAKITPLESEPDPPKQAHGHLDLTEQERNQILRESGVIEKLGLPPDFIPFEQLQQSHSHATAKGGRNRAKQRIVRGGPPKDRPSSTVAPEWTDDLSDSEDGYGSPSETEDDNLKRLMSETEATHMSPTTEKLLDLFIWTMPFGFLFALLDILVRQQYGETVSFLDQLFRLLKNVPILALFIHWNLHSTRKVLVQFVLFVLSLASGIALIYKVNKSPFEEVMQQVPPLGTVWIFTIARLDLLPACVGLVIVGTWVQFAGMKLIFDT